MANAFIDISGERFDRLVALRRVANHRSTGNAVFLCKCDCGNEVEVTGSHLRSHHTRSCGCRFVDFGGNHTHGATGTAEHDIWRSMLARCKDPKRDDYHGRGITVCDRWLKFENFLADMGPRPSSDYSVERQGNDGNYEPSNCIWATRSQQGRNKRSNRLVTFRGREMPLIEATELSGVNYGKAWLRLARLGWSDEEALCP